MTDFPQSIPTTEELHKALDKFVETPGNGLLDPAPNTKNGVFQGSGQHMVEGRAATARFMFKEALMHWNQGKHTVAHQLLEIGVRLFPDGDTGLDPQEKHILYNLELRYGISLLSMGDLEHGWVYYNRRKEPNSMGFSPARQFMAGNMVDGLNRRWTGQDLTDKVLVIYPEQGLGDQLLGLRPLIAGWQLNSCFDKIKELRIEAHWELLPILRRHLQHQPAIKIVDPGNMVECIGDADYACSYMDLLQQQVPSLHHLAPTMFHGSQDLLYITAEDKKAQEWRLKDYDLYHHVIGLNWRGHGDKWDKGVQIEHLKPLWLLLKLRDDVHVLVTHPLTDADKAWLDIEWGDIPDRQWQDQIHAPIKLPPFKGIEFEPPSMEDYAGMLAGCDYYLGVMSTTCHLAGAMGVPTMVLCPTGPRTPWYWAMDAIPEGGRSSWYNTVDVYDGDVWPTKGEAYDKPWSVGCWWTAVRDLVAKLD